MKLDSSRRDHGVAGGDLIGVVGDTYDGRELERGDLSEQRSPPLVALGSDVDPPLTAGTKGAQLAPGRIEVGSSERDGADQIATAATVGSSMKACLVTALNSRRSCAGHRARTAAGERNGSRR